MKKILFLLLASVLVLGLGCSSRAKTPSIKSKQITTGGDQQKVKPVTPSDDTSDTPDDTSDTPGGGTKDDTPGGGTKDTPDDKKTNPGTKDDSTKDTKVTIKSEIEDLESWDGKSDHAPKGYTIKDINTK